MLKGMTIGIHIKLQQKLIISSKEEFVTYLSICS